MASDLYIYKKEIDWSTLHLGVNIPVSLQNIFYENINIQLKKGEKKEIKLIVDNVAYDVMLTNIYFDQKKYPTHKELLQIRYTPTSSIANKLREVFSSTYNYLYQKKNELDNRRKQISIPEEQREYLVLYSTIHDDTFSVECITQDDISNAKEAIRQYDEFDIEQLLQKKSNSSILEKEKIVKIRKLDKTIGENLKRIYEYKCQICGLLIGQDQGVNVIHTHHIKYFSVSLNNNANNIIVICPNHHGIIHSANPVFDTKGKCFIYPNGYSEGLRLNVHL
jgi:predicted HNH restriction endonuclease